MTKRIQTILTNGNMIGTSDVLSYQKVVSNDIKRIRKNMILDDV